MLSLTQVVSSVIVLIGVICVVLILRRAGIIKSDQGPFFAKLVTQATLPALIFTSLVREPIMWTEAWFALWMFLAESLCLVIGWLIGRAMRLSGPQQGAFMLATAYGSSSLLGYALINQVFPGNAAAVAEAVVISEVAVGPSLFTIGVMVALYFGKADVDSKERWSNALQFFRSPIFFSMVLGLILANVGLPLENPVIRTIMDGLEVIGSANTFMVTLCVGAALNLKGLKEVAVLVLLACLLKLVAKPVMLWLPTQVMDVQLWQAQVLVLEAAMPAAMLSVALSARYGCDAPLAARLVFATTVISAISIPLMFSILG